MLLSACLAHATLRLLGSRYSLLAWLTLLSACLAHATGTYRFLGPQILPLATHATCCLTLDHSRYLPLAWLLASCSANPYWNFSIAQLPITYRYRLLGSRYWTLIQLTLTGTSQLYSNLSLTAWSAHATHCLIGSCYSLPLAWLTLLDAYSANTDRNFSIVQQPFTYCLIGSCYSLLDRLMLLTTACLAHATGRLFS